jgi:microcin C transport system ATP-binding protein
MSETNNILISVENLSVDFRAGEAVTQAVRNVSFDIGKAETVALVGESGSGKTVTALSILQLLPYPAASHPSGRISFDGEDLLTLNPSALRNVRGNKISMIFQEPMTSLNPLHTIEQQVGEVLKIHRGMSDKEARKRVLDLLDKAGIDDPKGRLQSYPHQLSGGQRQRVMIAMALANEPDLLIADEPTTALDVTIQAQILDLLLKLKAEFHMAMLLITHDLGIVRKMADRVCVMNGGKIVEQGKTREIFAARSTPTPSISSHRSRRARRRPPTPRPRPSSRPRTCAYGSRLGAASSGRRSAISRRSTASILRSRRGRRSA